MIDATIKRFIFVITVCIVVIFIIPVSVLAKPIVADLAIRSVDIDHNFTGLNILLFGARNDIGQIVVVLRGSKKSYIVRKKEKFAGIWINRESVNFTDVDSYYAIATSSDLKNIRNEALLSSLNIGIDNLEFNAIQSDTDVFKEALIKSRQDEELYSSEISEITFWGETLFRTILKFPKNIERGWYTAEVYLFSDGLLSSIQSTPIHVDKIGFAAYIFDMANENSLFYGILCVLTALICGWGASAIFGRI